MSDTASPYKIDSTAASSLDNISLLRVIIRNGYQLGEGGASFSRCNHNIYRDSSDTNHKQTTTVGVFTIGVVVSPVVR